uniref:Vitamin K-dependent protein C n=1 Tax=Timema genevievae TaxID=629358 RepID=A0A7R9PKE5_TIMGE|nr:unnamed protein product [Timema genevievae]
MLRILIVLGALAACLAAPTNETLPGKIVGGTTAAISQFPHMRDNKCIVLLQLALMNANNVQFCGASIISSNWGLTAAHCTIGFSANQLRVRAGSDYKASGGTIYVVSQIINHAGYSSQTIDNDISLIRLTNALVVLNPTAEDGEIEVRISVATPFVFSTTVRAISLGTAELAAGTYTTVTGWGATRSGGASSAVLLQVSVPVVDQATCSRQYNGITNGMLCAGYTAGGKDACQGDSGGPLISGGVLVGVVSWGGVCAAANQPGVYAKVSFYRSWIQTNSGV